MPKIIKDEHVFEAVIRVIGECGYERATTKQIAEAAGISEVTLFRKYGTKLQLVKQAIAHIIDQTNVKNVDLYTGDLRKDLINMVTIFRDSVIKHGNFVVILFVEMFRRPELAELLQQREHISQIFAEILARYQEEGKLKKENPMHAVAALLGPLIFSVLIPKMIPSGHVEPLNPEQNVDYFLNGRLLEGNQKTISTERKKLNDFSR